MTYIICFYRDGAHVHEAERTTLDAAEMLAMEGLREGCEVTIYRNGRALRAWNRRTA